MASSRVSLGRIQAPAEEELRFAYFANLTDAAGEYARGRYSKEMTSLAARDPNEECCTHAVCLQAHAAKKQLVVVTAACHVRSSFYDTLDTEFLINLNSEYSTFGDRPRSPCA